ncbi:MAG TPA: PfkB family carbohydrate kinase, partial [Vicinamibacteria bacterium]
MGDALDVCVLGRVGYDLYAVEPGRPLAEVEHFSRHLGGSSANIAVGLSRLGRRVAILSSVGDDALADYLISFLDKERVDARRVTRVAGYGTSLCLTEVSPPDRFPQVFYRYKPADSQVQVGEAELALVRRARMFVTNGTSLCASPSRESVTRAVETARAAGVRTVLDVDYRPSSWTSAEEAGRAARAVLPWIDVVIGNEDEVALLTGEKDPKAQVKAVLDGGAGLLVRKLGAAGVEAFSR